MISKFLLDIDIHTEDEVWELRHIVQMIWVSFTNIKEFFLFFFH